MLSGVRERLLTLSGFSRQQVRAPNCLDPHPEATVGPASGRFDWTLSHRNVGLRHWSGLG